jgi:hypothetical protein
MVPSIQRRRQLLLALLVGMGALGAGSSRRPSAQAEEGDGPAPGVQPSARGLRSILLNETRGQKYFEVGRRERVQLRRAAWVAVPCLKPPRRAAAQGYEFMLPLHARKRGIAYVGANERLRVAIDRFTQGGWRRPQAAGAAQLARCPPAAPPVSHRPPRYMPFIAPAAQPHAARRPAAQSALPHPPRRPEPVHRHRGRQHLGRPGRGGLCERQLLLQVRSAGHGAGRGAGRLLPGEQLRVPGGPGRSALQGPPPPGPSAPAAVRTPGPPGEPLAAWADRRPCRPACHPPRFTDMINTERQPGYGRAHVMNGAVGGTVSMFMSVCVKNHVPDDVDLVVVDYAGGVPAAALAGRGRAGRRPGAAWVGAAWAAVPARGAGFAARRSLRPGRAEHTRLPARPPALIPASQPASSPAHTARPPAQSPRAVNDPVTSGFETDVRRGFERLLRKLLGLPHSPAVVLLLNHNWFNADGRYYEGTAEPDFLTLASYYGCGAAAGLAGWPG